jgi:uncharacterized protein (TIGR00106 family)
MIAEFSIMPIGKDVHLSDEIAKAVKLIDESGIQYRVTPTGTILVGDWDRVMGVVQSCHDELMKSHDRVVIHLKIDDFGPERDHLDERVDSVLEKAGLK